MTNIVTVDVEEDDSGIRLDRWFKRHYPDLTHGRLEKLLRTGQIRVDGKRIRANARVESGQSIRVPPLPVVDAFAKPRVLPAKVSNADAERLVESILYQDDDVFAINKPPGLAVQGGSGMVHHLDGMLDVLKFGSKHRPRLVHRLDKDTSGVMLLARSPKAAKHFTEAFRTKTAQKIYWALVSGVPEF
ncbi:MAG: RluA family pseudouridine synthase, partial [Rhodospirillales bacterium]|nr:RluA family pseudouridine synthase [Rhodospirillales bacterium]